MKRVLSVLVFLFFIITINSQNDNFNYINELNKAINVPNSPEAQAFTKYGDVPVNLYTGKPNVEIPILNYKGLELDLPISLTYDIDARKVEDIASGVGLGWNLNAGGRISRIAQGLPDDNIDVVGSYKSFLDVNLTYDYQRFYQMSQNVDLSACGNPGGYSMVNNIAFDNMNDVNFFYQFTQAVYHGKYDTQLDYYSINALNINDYATMDMNMGPSTHDAYALNNSRLKVKFNRDNITRSIKDWNVTDESGAKYFFELAETTIVENTNADISTPVVAAFNTYNSSWVLTKIISKNGKDIYEFSYTDFGFWSENNHFPTSKLITSYDYGSFQTNFSQNDGTHVNLGTRYNIKQQHLTEIKHNGHTIVLLDLGNRLDLDQNQNSAIESIQIVDPIKNELINHYKLFHSYFKSTPNNNNLPITDLRLKLDSIGIAGSNYNNTNIFDKKYKFKYEGTNFMPSRISKSQDVLGFYNSKGNTVLWPRVDYTYTYEGADRSFDEVSAKKGILTQINYPTGGFSNFEYEQHQGWTNDYVTHKSTLSSLLATNIIGSVENCGTCCFDANGFRVNVQSDMFLVPQDSTAESIKYKIRYSEQGGYWDTKRAYLIGPFLSNGNEIPEGYSYDQILDCEDNENVHIIEEFTGISPEEVEVELHQDVYYQVLILNADGTDIDSSTNARITVVKEQKVIELVNLKNPGLRIKSIANYSDNNNIVSKKRFLYKTDYNSEFSTAGFYTKPLYTYREKTQVRAFDLGDTGGDSMYAPIRIISPLHRLSKPITNSSPPVRYKTVFEEQLNVNHLADNSQNGYVKHEFKTGENGISFPIKKIISNYKADNRIGKLIKKSFFNKNNDTIQSLENKYFKTNFYDVISGLNVKPDPGRNLNRIQLFYNCHNKIMMGYRDENIYTGGLTNEIDTSNFIPGSPCFPIPDLGCDGSTYPNIIQYESNPLLTLQYNFSIASGNVIGLEKTTQKSFFNSNVITQVTDYIYNEADKDYLLKEVNTENSTGQTVNQRFYYPKDFSENHENLIGEMIDKNQLTNIIKTKTTINSKENIKENEYIQKGNGIYISNIKTSKNNNELEPRIHYVYYGNGNLKMTYQIDTSDTSTAPIILESGINVVTYLWGYNNTLPIAKIQGVIYNDLPTELTAINSLDYSTATEENIRTALNNLRNALPNAMVTTYTYKPLIGVTSMTDPRGNVVYYHYDELNRLEYVKDKDGNILSKNDYNYKN